MITLDIPQEKIVVIEQASRQSNTDVESFILQHAFENALLMIESSNNNISVNAKEWQNIQNMLEAPSQPNKKMQNLFDRGFQLVHQ